MPKLLRDKYHTLPQLVQEAIEEFTVKKVYWPEDFQLPPLISWGEPYVDDRPDYLNYVNEMLDNGKITKLNARSFIQGLRTCGPEGKQLTNTIKQITK